MALNWEAVSLLSSLPPNPLKAEYAAIGGAATMWGAPARYAEGLHKERSLT